MGSDSARHEEENKSHEEEKNKRDYDEAQRRLEKLSKVSKGGRRMVLRR